MCWWWESERERAGGRARRSAPERPECLKSPSPLETHNMPLQCAPLNLRYDAPAERLRRRGSEGVAEERVEDVLHDRVTHQDEGTLVEGSRVEVRSGVVVGWAGGGAEEACW